MKTALILYGSKRGSTARAAELIVQELIAVGWTARAESAAGKTPADLDGYDLVILGSSTWGEGDLHQDIWPLEKALSDIDLTGRTMAAFGCGNSRYVTFGWAADILTNRLKNSGAFQPVPALKLDTIMGLDESAVIAWARRIADWLT